jgi:hypothetical protein
VDYSCWIDERLDLGRAYLERVEVRRRAHRIPGKHLGLLKLLSRNLLDLVGHVVQKLVVRNLGSEILESWFRSEKDLTRGEIG